MSPTQFRSGGQGSRRSDTIILLGRPLSKDRPPPPLEFVWNPHHTLRHSPSTPLTTAIAVILQFSHRAKKTAPDAIIVALAPQIFRPLLLTYPPARRHWRGARS